MRKSFYGRAFVTVNWLEASGDEQRTRYIEKFGYRVMRYWNSEVLSDIDAVLEDICSRAQDTT